LKTNRRESKPAQETYSEIGVLFRNAPDLIEDFEECLPGPAAHARTQAAASAQATMDGVEAAVGEITAESPTVEGQILASNPTSWRRTSRGASASSVPDNTKNLAEEERPTD
jgi:histone deacetylase complex regulatory component SIN3